MGNKSILLIGNPESGKSNFIGRLWLALKSKKGTLKSIVPPENISYVEEVTQHQLGGGFAPRTENAQVRREFSVEVKDDRIEESATLLIPDIIGETWKKAVEHLELPKVLMDQLKEASGALIFVRAHSPLNVQPLDWVNSKKLLSSGKIKGEVKPDIPTQVCLIEQLRFLEDSLKAPSNGDKPKVGIVISAWDTVDKETYEKGPENYLFKQFPLISGRIKDCEKLSIRVFGLSVFGGDFAVSTFKQKFHDGDYDDFGFVTVENRETSRWEKIGDITVPISWLLGVEEI